MKSVIGQSVGTVYALIFCHPKYKSVTTKGCDSVLIVTKYDVFYLLVMTSNVSSFVCFGTEGDYFSPYCTHSVAHIVCSLPRVSLCSAYCSSTTFLCDAILMGKELLHSPRWPDSPTWIAPDTPVREACSN